MRGLGVAANAVALVACTGALAVAGCGSSSGTAGGRGGSSSGASVGRPRTSASVTRFQLDQYGFSIIAAAGAAGKLWLGNDTEPNVYEVDPATGRVLRRVNVDPTNNAAIQGVAPLGRELWIGFSMGPNDSTVPAARSVSLANGAVGPWRTINSPKDFGLGQAFAVNGEAAFVACENSVTRLPFNGGLPRLRYLPDPKLELEITAIAATPRVVWAAILHVNRSDGAVVYSKSDLVGYDATTLKQISSQPLGQVTVTSLLARGSRLWATTADGPVLRIDPGGDIQSTDFPRTTQSIVGDGTGVWVIELKDGLVDHISNAGAINETIRFTTPDHSRKWDDRPQTLVSVPGELWVADYAATLWRIALPRHP